MRIIAFILVNTIPTHPEEQHLLFKQTSTTTTFSFDTNPVFGHVLIHVFCSGCNSGIDLVVALESTFFQLYSNAEQISVRLPRFRRNYVKRPVVVLTNNTVTKRLMCAALFKVATLVFWSWLSPMIVYLHKLFLLSRPLARMLLTPRWVSRQKDKRMRNSYP